MKQLKTINTEGVKPSDFGNEARCELDTRADTCCAGQNCRPIFYTGQQCEVQGFHDTFAPVPDVPIATVATAWSNPLTGEGYILIFHEALYFGRNMDHSLINPNQLQHYGVRVNDNPYNRAPDWAMGIELEQDKHIPFYLQGSTIFFNSRYLSDDELESYPHVVLTSDKPWDPHGLVMPGGMDDTDHPCNDRVIQRVQLNMSRGVKRHHHMYETDCVSISVNGNTE